MLTITIDEVPVASFGTIVRSNNLTPISVGETISLAELQGLRFVSAGSVAVTAASVYSVSDNGTSGGLAAPASIAEEVGISITKRSAVYAPLDINQVLATAIRAIS